MKRLLCILMIFSILFLSSCKKEAYPQPTSAEKEFEQLIEFYGSKQGEYEDKEACTAVMDWPCPDFETCIYYINEIVTATYKTSWQVNNHYLHEFELDTDFKETGISKTFYVPEISVNIWDCNHSSRDILYEEGEKYLLLMTRTIGPYMVSEYFKIVHQRMAIKLTDDGKIDIEDSILCKHNFYESIKDEEVKKAIDENRFIEYLLEETKGHAKVRNRYEILTTFDFQNILFQSPNVVKVKIIDDGNQSLSFVTTRKYDCKIEAVYKGERFATGDTISDVELPTHIVEVGGSYILALTDYSILSSRNSIYGIEMEDNVKAVLAELEK